MNKETFESLLNNLNKEEKEKFNYILNFYTKEHVYHNFDMFRQSLKQFKVFSMICYLAMGWCIIVKIKWVIEGLGWTGFTLLVAGGVIYTIGAVLYGLGKKKKYMHSVFHLCIFAGSLLHFLCILLYVV